MTYEEYKEHHVKRTFEGSLPAYIPVMSEGEFNQFHRRVAKTPELKENSMFRLNYKEIYLRIKKLIEKGSAGDKAEQLAVLEKVYETGAKELNLL